jgi:hypothetical protein
MMMYLPGSIEDGPFSGKTNTMACLLSSNMVKKGGLKCEEKKFVLLGNYKK